MGQDSLPIPAHYDPSSVGGVWRVPYQKIAAEAKHWAAAHGIQPASRDRNKLCLLLIDVQNTFCIPDFELYVGGASGTGAVDDNRRLCEFIYRNLNVITSIRPTMDTHQATQIFHGIFLVDDKDDHPPPYTMITTDDIECGKWRFNPALAPGFNIDTADGQAYLVHYVRQLKRSGKFELTIWPYHAMLGGIGHALVAAVEEAVFFHTIARFSQPDFNLKGDNPFTENYSVLRPEVSTGLQGEPIASENGMIIDQLRQHQALIVAGQAKSHCVAWTIDDLLDDIRQLDAGLAQRVYLLEDCTSAVVIPDVIDYREQADAAFRRFAAAGMHIVRSTDPVREWPGMALAG